MSPKTQARHRKKKETDGPSQEVQKDEKPSSNSPADSRKKAKSGQPKGKGKENNVIEQTAIPEENTATQSGAVKIDYKRIVIRCVMIIGIITIVNFTHTETMETFASQKDEIEKKHMTVSCSSDYSKELSNFPGCVPKKCGRMVSDSVITLSEVEALLVIAQKGLSLGGSAGGASILDLHSGALSKGNNFINIYAVDKEHRAITAEDLKIYGHVKNKIKDAIVRHFELKPDRLYLTHPTFFSRLTSMPSQTVHDEYWHPHVDKETYKSFHYTSLLYLTDYGHHFNGGRFIFVDKDSNKTVEPRAGRLSAFTSGSENLHFVEKVSSGTRFAITVSFTCDPKQAIKDPKLPKKG